MAFLVLIVSVLFACISSPPVVSLNPVDACWRGKANWATNRQALANCAVGFGKAAVGGSKGAIYVVTNPADDNKPGSLRFGVTQKKPLWITFARDMLIVLKSDLLVGSFKTIDGRGAKVQIANGRCIRIKRVTNVIIHGITFHNCKAPDGDAITVYGSTHVWVDHCHFSRCHDGLVDVTHGSTGVSITNNYFTQHDKVMLLGATDTAVEDKKMKVTVAFNVFGARCVERMPRVRHGIAHVANNRYEKWVMYAIGGSANPIISSEGNYFVAPDGNKVKKEVTKRMGTNWKAWKWQTSKDVFMNGAFFVPSGGPIAPFYGPGQAFPVAPGAQVPALTSSAGVLPCVPGKAC